MGRENKNGKKIVSKRFITKAAIEIYMTVIAFLVGFFISEVYEKELWDNERYGITIILALSFIISLIYFSVREKNNIKLLAVYHFILAACAICAVSGVANNPYILFVMIIPVFYDREAAMVSMVSMVAVLSLRFDSYPEFLLIPVILLTGVCAACLIRQKKAGFIIGYFVTYILGNTGFSIYCKESGTEYEKVSFIVLSVIAAVLYYLAGIIIKFICDKFIYKKMDIFTYKKITSGNFAAAEYMKEKSPSLYYHSMEVAELSYACAKKISASAKLAYAGGFYHDFGKLAGKDYIKEGFLLADKYKLPGEVKQIMAEHNVKYRLPHTKEAAIVMLADTGVSAIEYVHGNLNKKELSEKEIMENSINARMTGGYLKESGLSIKEFETIKNILVGIKENQ